MTRIIPKCELKVIFIMTFFWTLHISPELSFPSLQIQGPWVFAINLIVTLHDLGFTQFLPCPPCIF